MRLLTHQNTKALKANRHGYLQVNLELAPHQISGYNTCQHSDGCEEACIFTAGRGIFPNVMNARIERTHLFFQERDIFWAMLLGELKQAERDARRAGLKLACRLNTFSDLPWWRMSVMGGPVSIFEMFPRVQFFDYTKRPWQDVPRLENYHVTVSAGCSWSQIDTQNAIMAGFNVAMVFDQVPDTYHGHSVIDGDTHDLRFLDPVGVIVGLRSKGQTRAKTAGRNTGFIQIQA